MCCVVHDYSEGYACWQQDEIQSEYFDVAKVSLHVTILHRHAVEVDGVARTEENPRLVKDHILSYLMTQFKIMTVFTKIQELICDYLTTTVSYNNQMMHEFTDGCAAQ